MVLLEQGHTVYGVARSYTDEFLIILCKTKDEFEAYTLEELLPMSFGPEFM